MIHRGPDDAGIYTDDLVVLGHRRFSIIDLSSAGRLVKTSEAESGKILVHLRSSLGLSGTTEADDFGTTTSHHIVECGREDSHTDLPRFCKGTEGTILFNMKFVF